MEGSYQCEEGEREGGGRREGGMGENVKEDGGECEEGGGRIGGECGE